MTVQDYIRERGWTRLDVGTALLAAVSACFLAYAAPDWRLGQLIGTLRLDDLIPAFQPPLGNKIRLAFMLLAAAGAFVGALALMRLADRLPAGRRREAEPELEPVPEPIRRRRAEFAGAPAHRPIRPGRDDAAVDAPPPPEPVAAESPAAPEPEPVPEPEAPAAAAETPPQPAEEPAPVLRTDPPEERIAAEPAAFAPPPEPEQPQPPRARDDDEEEDQSLSRLMRRLERGVGKRQQLRAAAAEAPAPEQPPAESAGHRLRSAIADLQKLAAPGG